MECSCEQLHTNAKPRVGSINARLRRDPTRTTTLQKRFIKELERRFNRIKSAITDAIVVKDIFGLNQRQPMVLSELQPQAFQFKSTSDKIQSFMDWIHGMEKENILTIESRPGALYGGPWSNTYIQSAYQIGISRARAELRKQGYAVPPTTGFTPTGMDPIAVAMNQPFNLDRVAILYTRTFNELKGITDAMDQQISRVLAQGLVDGRNPMDIASDLNAKVDGIGINRARTLARTEIVSAHHQATINEYEQWGALGVSVMAEWLTAGYNVCEYCYSMNGKVFSLDEIRGAIPAHPNCRCCALPIRNTRRRG